MKSVDITIDRHGAVQVDAKGFKGKGCAEATEQIQLVLGGSQDTKKKPEYFTPGVSNHNRAKDVF